MDILQLSHDTNNWMERLKYSILCTRIPDPTEYTNDTRTDIVSICETHILPLFPVHQQTMPEEQLLYVFARIKCIIRNQSIGWD